ncbi:membrane transport protein [Sulfurimonas gotlandica GD1]|jgi:DASS family divalent anion:Na+ symporter|uniref:Membrane transport protein n=1 Tax=Sulfurimonas gotlandica (strain DSM 19862 / JCM 16533 / GD1) TaxID=929558 RepID=B6BJL9_SULGG|nr:DASS family sodium-coupled anion symporter [Sulfurimonas gotlandica]EDZ62614.1 2-oxoglutarate/malate translocator [Sulfurimonas gotlandica GD1]EHP31264.1 membrane transport protein [Sulfurimonas gotlandica GD1]
MSHHPLQTMKQHYLQLFIFAFGATIWFSPVPSGLEPQAWQLFAIFISAILAVIIKAMPIFTSSILALSVSVLTGTLTTDQAYSGFSEEFILLIIVAFLIARGVIKSGLGKRIAFLIIKRFGKSSLGLAYSIIAADMFISPAFPSNTARSGVLYPIVNALSVDSGSKIADGTRKKLGSFLMMSSMAGLTLSSTLWLTAMAANPAGAKMAKDFGVEITYGSWALGASLPVLILFFLVPWVIFKIYPPEIKETPEAPAIAIEALKHMGPVHKNEWIMAATFVGMVFLWVMSGSWGLDKTAVAFLGLGVLMVTNIFTLEDMRGEGNALSTLVWFSILFAMSVYLDKLGFMGWVGAHISDMVVGLDWPVVYVGLTIAYVLIHYFFVSQTAQMLALFSVFLSVAISAGVPPELMALMLLFATNFNAIITPQGSSANVIYAGSGYLEPGEIYKVGGIITLINTVVFLTIGTGWLLLIL